MSHVALVSLLFCCSYDSAGDTIRYRAVQKFTKPDRQENDRFGDAVAVAGDVIAITAREDDTFARDGGAVYLFDRNGTHLRTIGSPSPQIGGFFGEYMASVGDDKLLVSARFENVRSGRVYLYNVNGELLHTFTAPDRQGGAEFGGRVVTSLGDKVLIGSTRDHSEGDNGGAAYLFDVGGELLQTFTSPRPDLDACLGRSGAFVGSDKVLIGDACDSSSGASKSGAAFLFDLEGNLLVTFDNPRPEPLDGFGSSVAYANGRILIGGVQIDDEFNDASTGAAYIYDLDGSLVTRVSDPEPNPGNWFGWSSGSINEELFIVGSVFNSTGANRAGKAFVVDTSGEILTSLSSPESGGQQFGPAFATLGENLLIGEPQNDGGFPVGLGAVWMFAPVDPGDFNWNGQFDIFDVEQLCSAIARNETRATFDLNDDQIVDGADLDFFLDASGLVGGDADFDGSVTFDDFVRLANHFGEANRTWSHGDFDCDGVVEVEDFTILADNFGHASVITSSVPEPNAIFIAITLLAMLQFLPALRPHTGQIKRGHSTLTFPVLYST